MIFWLLVWGFLFMCENSAQALPQGLLVESGQATVDTSSPDTLIITASDQAILSFEDFSIGANETVQFNLPDSASSVLNRVAGINASDIIGSLLSNGRIFLVNSNGIHIAPGALVQAQDFIASTLDIQNAMFLANQFSFEAVTGKMSSILNEGNIRSGNGGNVVLLAQEVMNNGLIQADLGHVVLGSASKATLNFNSEGLVNLVIDEALAERLSSNSPVTNHGQILAQGGRVTLTAEDITGALNATVNNTGVIEAAGVVEHDGIIELISNSGTASSSGSLTATTVNLTAKNIELSGSLDAQNGSLASAKEDINVTNDLTVKGNLTLEADSDQDGSGS
ncbi:MAG: filamentous hemagglutinin N-terminal domain-containing protein, partial [Candidatus Omnitrophica bacterium]|nr:filamentous hemagglutinin N-terminal domain-containing protein [Candidatus Omnitrophota bacterium]